MQTSAYRRERRLRSAARSAVNDGHISFVVALAGGRREVVQPRLSPRRPRIPWSYPQFPQGKLYNTCRLPVNGIGWHVAIQGFKCKDTEKLFRTEKSRRFGAIRKGATRKLTMLEGVTVLEDLKSPPGNRLEALVSDRAGQHSIRVNDQFRICFVWTDTGPTDVEITNHYA